MLAVALLPVAAVVAENSATATVAGESSDPARQWEFDFQTGALWRVGGRSSRLDYVILPQLLTWKTPSFWQRRVGGRDLVMRSRLSVLLESIARGPENYFVGVAAAGTLEWWNDARTQAWFVSSGGGFGVMDSRGGTVAGAQGQDFNLNWLLYFGSRFRWRENLNASVGVYFQHLSNGGMAEPNPGVDALGPMVSLGWKF